MNNIKFKLDGLTCEACVKLVTSRFKKVPGVQEVNINLKTGETEVLGGGNLDLGRLRDSLMGSEFSIVK